MPANIGFQPTSLPIVPRKFCNKSGPSNWRRCAFEFIKFCGLPDPFDDSSAGSVKFPKRLFLTGMIVAIAGSILRCTFLAINHKTSCGSILNVSVLSTSLTTGLLAGGACMSVVFLIGCCVSLFLRMSVMSPSDYQQYLLLNEFQKILDENKLELAYRKIHIFPNILDNGLLRSKFRNELRKKFLKKLLQIGCFELKTLFRLIRINDGCDHDVYYAMCAKEIYEATGDAERTYLMIGFIDDSKTKKALCREYAIKLRDQKSLRMAQKVLSGIQSVGGGPLQLITEYAEPNWEMSILFANDAGEKLDAERYKVGADFESRIKMHQRIQENAERFLNEILAILDDLPEECCDPEFCDPEVLCALQRMDGERQASERHSIS